uniref:Uncharacterized protein n=1 Tax=viral metagenome TaxID=1070528 RepID=A0A6C0JCQ7_9ZZZZ
MILIIISFILGTIIVYLNSKKVNYINLIVISIIIYIILLFIKLKIYKIENFNCKTNKCINKTAVIQNKQIKEKDTPLMPIIPTQKALNQIKKTQSISTHTLDKTENKSSKIELAPKSNIEEEILKKIDILNTKVNNLIQLEGSHNEYNINEMPHYNIDKNRIRDENQQKKRLNVGGTPRHIMGYSYVDPKDWTDINRRGTLKHSFNEKDSNPSAHSRFFSI